MGVGSVVSRAGPAEHLGDRIAVNDMWIVLIGVSAGWVLSHIHPACDPLVHQEAPTAHPRTAHTRPGVSGPALRASALRCAAL